MTHSNIKSLPAFCYQNIVNILIISPGRFRLSLALLVLLSHFFSIYIGRTAVSLFFMLSGYWISFLWNGIGGTQHPFKFALNRILRIFPLYLVVTAVCIVFFTVHLTPSTFLLIGVASTQGPNAVGVEWSLDIELQFYLVFPLLAMMLKRGMVGVSSLFIFCLIGWFIYKRTGVMTVLQFIPVFCVGMYIFRSRVFVTQRVALFSLCGAIGTFALAGIIPATHSLVIARTGVPIIEPDLFAMLISLLLAPYVAASLRKPAGKADRAFGDTSYPLYLVHEPIIRGYKRVAGFAGGQQGNISFGVKIELIVLIFLITGVVYVLIDRPIEFLRRRWLG